ncbi:MAG: hypothetical protein GQ559_08550, partial [Desulfobulbaceae bacterium]|nr:hypothetical protein [Desulfobulbaceae bacterium]
VTPDQKEALGVLSSSTEHLQSLIDELLRFAYIAGGEMELDLKPHKLEDVLERSYDRCLEKAKERNIDLQLDLPEELPVIRVDGEKLHLALMQLLTNAIKFTPKESSVRIGGRYDGGSVIVFVKDNGIGIAGDKQDEIFEPFYQLDGTLARQYGGMGLGLAMVKRIVEAHNSEIFVISSLGRGSCFEFSLPVEIRR